MGKKIKFRTPLAAELKQKYDNLYAEYKAEKERCSQIFIEYCHMEGKYGKMACDPWDCGQGMRGYHYEYSSRELEQKELDEREQFLKDNNYRHQNDIWEAYKPLLDEAEEAFNLEQYGMTTKERQLRKILAGYEKNVAEAKKEVIYWEEQVRKAKKELGDYLETTEQGRPLFFN